MSAEFGKNNYSNRSLFNGSFCLLQHLQILHVNVRFLQDTILIAVHVRMYNRPNSALV